MESLFEEVQVRFDPPWDDHGSRWLEDFKKRWQREVESYRYTVYQFLSPFQDFDQDWEEFLLHVTTHDVLTKTCRPTTVRYKRCLPCGLWTIQFLRSRLVHESHWSLMGFWTAKWKFSREHVSELTSDILKFTIFTKDSDTCDIFVFRKCECAFYIYNNSTYICWFTYLSTHYKDRAWTNLWENCRTVMATSHLKEQILRIQCQETQETETEALPPERSSLRQRKVSDKPVTTTVSWQSEVPVLRVVMTRVWWD